MCKRNSVASQLCRQDLGNCHKHRGIKLIIIIIKIFLHLHIYKWTLHFLGQQCRVSQLRLGAGVEATPAPWPVMVRCWAGDVRRRRPAAPGLQGGAGSCAGSWGSVGRWGWSCWMESSVWWNLNQAVNTQKGDSVRTHCPGAVAQPHVGVCGDMW